MSLTELDRGQFSPDAHENSVPVEPSPPTDQRTSGFQDSFVGGADPSDSTAIPVPHSTPNPLSGQLLAADHLRPVTHGDSVGGDFSTGGHGSCDLRGGAAPVEPSPTPATKSTPPSKGVTSLAWDFANAELLILAGMVSDLEEQRKATDNRLRSLGRDLGLDGTKEMAKLQEIADGLAKLEHNAVTALERSMKRHPLGPWVKAQKGVGFKTAARLLAAVGDPGERSNPAKLWAYCGYHVVDGQAARRRKGVRANWSNEAKVRAFLVAESCIKQMDGEYRKVYDAGREKYADAVHSADCPQCHAKAGEPLKPGHQHARAMRLVAKAVLLDLWREARQLREAPTDKGECGVIHAAVLTD